MKQLLFVLPSGRTAEYSAPDNTPHAVMLDKVGARILVEAEAAEALEAIGYSYHVPRCRVCGEPVQTEPKLSGTYVHPECE